MSDAQNWRTEIDSGDYFLHQKKSASVADRRPVIRKASDLVGPGISATAIKITDFNDALATYNGYYSAVTGTINAPNADEAFIGMTVMDDLLGGRQVFTGLDSGSEYARLFLRNPSDPGSITWGLWAPVYTAATPRTVWGIVNTAGSGTIIEGTGFSITRHGTGDLTVTFDTAFSGVPAVVFGSRGDGSALGPIVAHDDATARSAASFRVEIVEIATGFTDGTFDFIAMGLA